MYYQQVMYDVKFRFKLPSSCSENGKQHKGIVFLPDVGN